MVENKSKARENVEFAIRSALSDLCTLTENMGWNLTPDIVWKMAETAVDAIFLEQSIWALEEMLTERLLKQAPIEKGIDIDVSGGYDDVSAEKDKEADYLEGNIEDAKVYDKNGTLLYDAGAPKDPDVSGDYDEGRTDIAQVIKRRVTITRGRGLRQDRGEAQG